MKRGEVWWANLDSPVGRRPVVLVSRNRSYGIRSAAIVATVTRTVRNLPTEVALGIAEGLPAPCVVNFDNLFTLPKTRLDMLAGELPQEKIVAMNAALRFALGLD